MFGSLSILEYHVFIPSQILEKFIAFRSSFFGSIFPCFWLFSFISSLHFDSVCIFFYFYYTIILFILICFKIVLLPYMIRFEHVQLYENMLFDPCMSFAQWCMVTYNSKRESYAYVIFKKLIVEQVVNRL